MTSLLGRRYTYIHNKKKIFQIGYKRRRYEVPNEKKRIENLLFFKYVKNENVESLKIRVLRF